MILFCVLGAARASSAGEIQGSLLHVDRLRGNPASLPGPQPYQTLLTGGEKGAKIQFLYARYSIV